MKKLLKKKLRILKRKSRNAKRAVLIMQKKTVKKSNKFFKIIFSLIKNFNFKIPHLNLSKVGAVVMVFGMVVQLAGISPTKTLALFSDQEDSTQNTFSASSLDIELSLTQKYSSGIMYPTDATSTFFSLSNSGNLGLNYLSKIELLGGNKEPCDFVMVTASSTMGLSTSTFSGLMTDFITPTSTATSTPITSVDWQFDFSLATDTPPTVWGKTCYFKWIFNAWQSDSLDLNSGFSDTEERLGEIKIGKAVVMNEFISNPSGLDNAPKPGGEWVELYNNSNREYDLNNWVLFDEENTHELYIVGANTNTGGTIIAPHSYLVVYRNGDSDFNLNNNADSVRLATGYPFESFVLVDSYTYSEEKPEGFSYARIPDGVGAWVDPIPTPGESNVNTESASMVFELVPEPVSEEVVSQDSVLGSESVISEPEKAKSSGGGSPIVPKVEEPVIVEDEQALVPETIPAEEINQSVVTEDPVIEEPAPIVTPEVVSNPEELPAPTTESAPEEIQPEVPPVVIEPEIITPPAPTEEPVAGGGNE